MAPSAPDPAIPQPLARPQGATDIDGAGKPEGVHAGALRVALVGVHGFGMHHLRNLKRLQEKGLVSLVAVADPNPPAEGALPAETAIFANLDDLLERTPSLDVVIVATPIQTHAALALAALTAADLYLEKPPVASLADFQRLQTAAESAGRSVQIGFQSLGSHALEAIRDLVALGEIGDLLGITATGRWVRDRAYYKRSRWAGKRSIDGVDVVDGVATNPLAHAIATALRIADARRFDDLVSVETDLYRANDIESDDTSVIRLRTVTGIPITCALTLCAAESAEPYITVQGSEGSAVFHYTEDRLSVLTSHGERREIFGRDDLTENLLEHLTEGGPLISPLADSGAFMRVLEAIRTAEAPTRIGDEFIVWEGEGEAAHAVVAGIEDALDRATAAHATFSELALPWARPLPGEPAAALSLEGQEQYDGALASLRTGTTLAERLSPRPYLHPVRSLAGVEMSDHLPSDHPWHLGVGIALQDVNGTNFWGGKTYTRSARRYEERDDHGIILQTGCTVAPGLLEQELSWRARDGAEVLRERRSTKATYVDHSTWRFDLETELTAVVPASLGGPGSNGAAGSGYGGFFWRLPPCTDVNVFTSERSGEPLVHGSVAPWLAWTADFTEGPASLVFAAPPQSRDPWFVRVADYPGIGSALVWERRVDLAAGEAVTRTFTVWVRDGRLNAAEGAAISAQL